MSKADLKKSRDWGRVYSLFGRDQSLQRIGDQMGIAKQSVAWRVSQLERQAGQVAAVSAYSPEYLDFYLRALVQWSSEVRADADGNPADPAAIQAAIVLHLQAAVEHLQMQGNPTPGQ